MAHTRFYFQNQLRNQILSKLYQFKHCPEKSCNVNPSSSFKYLGTRVCSVQHTEALPGCHVLKRNGRRKHHCENTLSILSLCLYHQIKFFKGLGQKRLKYLRSLQRKSCRRGNALSTLEVCFSSLHSLSATALALGL